MDQKEIQIPNPKVQSRPTNIFSPIKESPQVLYHANTENKINFINCSPFVPTSQTPARCGEWGNFIPKNISAETPIQPSRCFSPLISGTASKIQDQQNSSSVQKNLMGELIFSPFRAPVYYWSPGNSNMGNAPFSERENNKE